MSDIAFPVFALLISVLLVMVAVYSIRLYLEI
jgi:hypothetical protein